MKTKPPSPYDVVPVTLSLTGNHFYGYLAENNICLSLSFFFVCAPLSLTVHTASSPDRC